MNKKPTFYIKELITSLQKDDSNAKELVELFEYIDNYLTKDGTIRTLLSKLRGEKKVQEGRQGKITAQLDNIKQLRNAMAHEGLSEDKIND